MLTELLPRQTYFGLALLATSISPLLAAEEVVTKSGGLQESATVANLNHDTRKLSVSYTIKNISKKTYRMFIGEPARAIDTSGHHWETYNVDDVTGIWACKNNLYYSPCLGKKRIKEVEENATLIAPGEEISIDITMVNKGNEIETPGQFVSVALTAHVQDIQHSESGADVIGPWHTLSIGVPKIKLNSD